MEIIHCYNERTQYCLILEIKCIWIDYLNFNGSFNSIQYLTGTLFKFILAIMIVAVDIRCLLILSINLQSKKKKNLN